MFILLIQTSQSFTISTSFVGMLAGDDSFKKFYTKFYFASPVCFVSQDYWINLPSTV